MLNGLECLISSLTSWIHSPQCTVNPWNKEEEPISKEQSLQGSLESFRKDYFVPVTHFSASRNKRHSQMRFSVENGVLTIKNQKAPTKSQKSFLINKHQSNPNKGAHWSEGSQANCWRRQSCLLPDLTERLTSCESQESQESNEHSPEMAKVQIKAKKESEWGLDYQEAQKGSNKEEEISKENMSAFRRSFLSFKSYFF